LARYFLQIAHSILLKPTFHVLSWKKKIKAVFLDDSASRLSVLGDSSTGKTNLVLNYVKVCRQRYQGKFCIDCRATTSVMQDLLSIYIYVSERRPKLSMTLNDCILAIKKYFSTQDGPWLIALSKVDCLISV